MLDLILDAIKILHVIYNLREELRDNDKACQLLCGRVTIFDSWLQDWKEKNRLPYNASLVLSIQSLLTLLTEIRDFLRKFTKQGGSILGQAKRVTKKAFFSRKMAEKLNDFHRRIDQCALALNICLTTSAEDKRREEMVALRNELNTHSDDLMEELGALNRDPDELKELLEALREEAGEDNAAILREISSLQQKVEGKASWDLSRLNESLKESNEALVVQMEKLCELFARDLSDVKAIMIRLQAAAQQGDVRVLEQLKAMETKVSHHCSVSMEEVHALKQSLQDVSREDVKALKDKLEALDLLSLKDDLTQVKSLLQGLKEAAASQADKQRLEELAKRLEEKIDDRQAITLQELEGLKGLVKRDEAEVVMKALAAKIDSLDLLSVQEYLVEVRGEVMATRQTGEVILEEVNEVKAMMMKLLDDKKLTKAEEQYRARLLKRMLIPSGMVRVADKSVKLGVGGFGEVNLALYQNKKVAVKSFFSLRGSILSIAQRDFTAVENEVLLMGGYLGSHPTIVSCYGYFKDEHQKISMVMELAPYGCLSAMLDDYDNFTFLSFRLILGWLNDLIDAVRFIHEHEVKHRDVKVDNLLVFADLDVKLCDFGLARQNSCQKQSTMIGGTFDFLAPEVVGLKGSSYASDVFSWAMTAAHMILRRIPDRRNDLSSLIDQVMEIVRVDGDMATFPSSLQVAISFQMLLKECLETDPSKRPSASTVSTVLQELLNKVGGDPRHKLTINDKNYIETVVRTADEKSSYAVAGVSSPLSSPLKEEATSPTPSTPIRGFAVVKRELSSLSHDQAIEMLIQLGCCFDLKERCLEEMDGRYLNGVTKMEHLREIGDTKSREPILNSVLRDLQKMQKEGVPLDLMQAIMESLTERACREEELKRKNAILNLHLRIKQTLQHMAASGDVSALQELQALGSSIDHIPPEDINQGFAADLSDDARGKGLEGVTALHIAAAKGHLELVRLLLLHPAITVNAVDSQNEWTPLYVACREGPEKVVMVLLADSRVDINKKNKYGGTPLYGACLKGYVEAVKALLSDTRVVDVNAEDERKYTPFHCACLKGHMEVVKLLLSDNRLRTINKANECGLTPLHYACSGGHIEVVKLLLSDSRLDSIYKTSKRGKTPLDLAKTEDIKQLLREHAARITSNT